MQVGQRCGSYELVEPIGRGGMGEVWRARHAILRRPAAIKIIHPEHWAASSPAMLAELTRRFEREAQALSQLRSPHTVQILDFGSLPGGAFYYAMELLEGLSLQELVERHGAVGPARAITIARQMCDALAEAHAAGLIHRDIKPANVFLCRLGLQVDFVKLLDFGLVKRTTSAGEGDRSALTAAGIGPGSPAFMAPELANGGAAPDARADLYAVGCVLYWLLTGALVFEAEAPLQMLLAHVSAVPVLVGERAPGPVPEALQAVVMACLQKKPDDRPRDALVLRDALAACSALDRWDEKDATAWWDTHTHRESVASATPAAAVAGARRAGPAVAAEAEPGPHALDTRLVMQDLLDSDPLGGARADSRSLLQRGFAESRIDLREFEARLVKVRSARTPAELERVVADLAPAPEATPLPIVERPARALMARPASSALVSVFGSQERRGVWRVPPSLKVVSVFGNNELDLRRAVLEPGVTDIVCVSVLGNIEITVPPDLHVVVEGVGVLGSFEHSGEGHREPVPGAPTVVIRGTAVAGNVEVRVPRWGRRKKKRDLLGSGDD